MFLKKPQFRAYGIFPSGYEYKGDPRFFSLPKNPLLTPKQITAFPNAGHGSVLWPNARLFANHRRTVEAFPPEVDCDLVPVWNSNSIVCRAAIGVFIGLITMILTRSPIISAVLSTVPVMLPDSPPMTPGDEI